MTRNNNNLSILPFYGSIEEQNHKKDYAFGKKFPLVCDVFKLLPFVIVRPHQSSSSISAVNIHGATSEDLTAEMLDKGLTITQFASEGLDLIHFPASLSLVGTSTGLGQHYLSVDDGFNVYYSDYFNTVKNPDGRYLKLEYWDNENFIYSGGAIPYASGFKNYCYLDTQLGRPEYPFSETAKTRDGHVFVEKQISEKKYKFNFLAPEYLCDALRIVRMHDHVKVYSKGISYEVENILITPDWQDQGDLANVEVEFEIDSVIKKIGSLAPIAEFSYSDDYNADYDIDN